MSALPPNCPLTAEQFARLPVEMQTSETMIWVKDAQNPDPETLDAINAVCNHAVLTSLAPLYFALPSLATPPAAHTPSNHATERGAVRERAADGV